VPLAFHGRQDSLRAEQRPLQVEVMAAVPIVLGHVVQHYLPEDARVMDQDVYAPVGFQGHGDGPLVVRPLADIRLDEEGVPSGLADLLHDALAGLGVPAGGDDRRALTGKDAGDPASDPGACPGHEGDTSLNSFHSKPLLRRPGD